MKIEAIAIAKEKSTLRCSRLPQDAVGACRVKIQVALEQVLAGRAMAPARRALAWADVGHAPADPMMAPADTAMAPADRIEILADRVLALVELEKAPVATVLVPDVRGGPCSLGRRTP
jgi:hypothetical protein